MQTPAGPSLQLIFLLCDALAEVTSVAAVAACNRWLGPQHFRRKLSQFESVGWLEFSGPAGSTDRILRLTESGRVAALGGRDAESFWRRRWDGHWRLVLFDVPETQRALRDRLRCRLRTLGFGYFQRSVWVSPDSIEQLVSTMRGADIDVGTLSLMEAHPFGGETDADLVRESWNFEQINRDYALYMDILDDQPRRAGDPGWRAWFEVEWRAWCRAFMGDPLLPEVLLPAGYRGKEASQRRMAALRQLGLGERVEFTKGSWPNSTARGEAP